MKTGHRVATPASLAASAAAVLTFDQSALAYAVLIDSWEGANVYALSYTSAQDTLSIRRSYECTEGNVPYRASYTAFITVRYDGTPLDRMTVTGIAIRNESSTNAIFSSASFSPSGNTFYSRRVAPNSTTWLTEGIDPPPFDVDVDRGNNLDMAQFRVHIGAAGGQPICPKVSSIIWEGGGGGK